MNSRDPLLGPQSDRDLRRPGRGQGAGGVRPRDPLTDEIRRRQHSRAVVMALALGAFVILVYFITIARMSGN